MGKKDPQQMTTGEVAKMARKAGVEDTGEMNKQQMIDAMREQMPSSKGQRPQGEMGMESGQQKNMPGNR